MDHLENDYNTEFPPLPYKEVVLYGCSLYERVFNDFSSTPIEVDGIITFTEKDVINAPHLKCLVGIPLRFKLN